MRCEHDDPDARSHPRGGVVKRAPRAYPAPKFANPRDAARANAWRRAHLARVGVEAIAPCPCSCGF
ncbi:hypothetical protein ABK046_48825, partial [Streptomyces caeruleatus]